MARSRYIYLAQVGGQPLAAFTVKHELLRWLRGWITEADPETVSGLRLWRMMDGQDTTPAPMSLTRLLGPEEV